MSRRRSRLLVFRSPPRRAVMRVERCLVSLERALPPEAAEAQREWRRTYRAFEELKTQLAGEIQELPPMRREVESALRTMLQGLADVNVRRSMWFVCPICLMKWLQLVSLTCEWA